MSQVIYGKKNYPINYFQVFITKLDKGDIENGCVN